MSVDIDVIRACWKGIVGGRNELCEREVKRKGSMGHRRGPGFLYDWKETEIFYVEGDMT